MSLVSHREEALRALREAAHQGLEECGDVAERYAKEAAPVQTWRLRDSIGHTVNENALTVGAGVPYADEVELGGPQRGPRPYLRPAMEGHTDEYKGIMERALRG